MDSLQIRQAFLDFFAGHGHAVVRSSSIVPQGDPTLYFTNAGMVQFKDVFVGAETRDYTRATSSQKCLRVSGKHNDLENVGRTNRHHTFFEMLGNFSFGDYFKRDAIRFGWEFLTSDAWMGLPVERLSATVFCGEDGVPFDEDAYRVWRDEIGIDEAMIFRLGKEDNFWSMGDTGPCGPCSEIHFHQGEHLPCEEEEAGRQCLGVACECDRWVEIWNLVFMQFNRDAAGILTPLAKPGVDTGMGLERLVAVKQGVLSTFDTDLLTPIILKVAEMAGITYGDDTERDVSLRVVADHARATAVCIADGVFPEKGGREYVLRRIMRRAIRHGTLLGFDQPFFAEVCAEVVRRLGPAFPELPARQKLIENIAHAEEVAFRRTLDRGLDKLRGAVDRAVEAKEKALPVQFVGDLYATDGFPIDLTRLIAEESGLSVDEGAAHAWIAKTHGGSGSKVGEQAVATVHKALAERLGASEFLGYEQEQAEAEVSALVLDGAEVQRLSAGQKGEVVLQASPLYGRSGGQVGDRGALSWEGGCVTVNDTLKPGGALLVHQVTVDQGELTVGQRVTATVDHQRRQAIRLNHSATHLLHHALRTVLGEHVAQKGSEVNPDYLRFDFSHFEGLSSDQVSEIEDHVNNEIRRNEASLTEVLPFDEARKQGAMALFGEKYGDSVRVVHIGTQSLELCGGTHVAQAGEIGLFKLVSEEALALGVRRVVAVTGEQAVRRGRRTEAQLHEAAALLKCGPDQVGDRLARLQEQLKDQERQLAQLKQKLATGGGTDLLAGVVEHDGFKLLATRVEAADPKTLRQAGDTLRDRIGSGVLVLAGEHKGKAALLVMVTKDLTKKVHAGKLMKELAARLGGRGGGRPDMAQGGGPDIGALDRVLAEVPQILTQK